MKTVIGPAIKYFALFLLLYGALTGISLIPQVGDLCNRLYRTPTEPILGWMLPKAYLQIKADGVYKETLRIEFASKAAVAAQTANAKKGAMATITGMSNNVNFHNLFLSFFLFYVALVLLSPISWKDKIISMVAGTVLYYLYTVFKLYLIQLMFFNQPDIAIYQTGPTALNLVKGIRFCMTLGTNVLVVLLIWAALVLKKDNWRGLLGGTKI